ncbi:DNRLRE domain-containing protein [Streptomyces sp. R302]|uniref:DNRLRE domain-containing protein n=1 Tax=unclassified Streptomyces TaxID=2593676 RepID=UPI00145D2031|nr:MULTISPECIES: FG-GAP-like repeat-containing protein [unclassified Streptomyces]NML51037.1 DNRLRE domain-containing protein [Streptomyces sp. R301]NML81131.1 DNRLRE domain-containing protein [Streptomyces sp. R302]
MTVRQRRLPGRRASALVLTAALAAGGITYAGFHTGSENAPASAPSAGKAPARKQPAAVDGRTALARAKKSGKQVEVTAERTARSSTWARPDGLMMLRSYAAPVWAKVGEEWKPIDTTLRRTGDGWQPRATNTRVVFSAGGPDGERASRGGVRRVLLLPALPAEAGTASPLVALTVTDADGAAHTIQLTWPGTVPAPIIDGSRALYPEILPGADLVLTAEDDGFAQMLVVKNRQAAADPRVAQLSYGLTSPTLDFRLDTLSGIVAAETPRGEEVALSPTPLMWDSSGAPAVTDGEAGASAQPTASESPEATLPTPPTAAPVATATEELADDVVDPENEVLPTATDGAAPTISDPPLPTVPGEPTPTPSQPDTGATLNLPLLNGPSPESRGDVVEADLSQGNWTLAPSTDFLNDPATVYPVFIDPTVKKHTQDWTTAYSRHPKATFFNGKDFNKGGTHEARVGFESDTWGTSRSYFNIAFDKKIKGAKIQKATLRVLETYSWSCSARSMSVHLTSPVNSRTNWSNAPKLHDGNLAARIRSFAHGYKTGCRDAYETFDVTAAAQTTSNKGKDLITFGLRARNENSQYAWKKFRADGDNAPVLEVTYNRAPRTPYELDLGPDFKCSTGAPYPRVGSTDINFTARSGDWDDNLAHLDFNLWPSGKWGITGDMLGSTGTVSVGADTTDAKRTTSAFPTSRLVNNTLYSWQVRAVDKAGATSVFAPYKSPCRFIFDSAAPRAPRVTSTDFPNADGNENAFGNEPEDKNWSKKKFGSSGVVTFRALETDVIRYEYGYNTNSFPHTVARTAGTATTVAANVTATPPAAGPNVLYVRTVDGAGHVSEPTKYFFYVTPRDQADVAGDFTGDTLPDLFSITAGGNLRMFPSQTAPGSNPVKGNGDTDFSMSGAYQENPERDPNGDSLEPFIAPAAGHFSNALITHNGDFYGGDGLQDLIARVEGKLWVYPGDGYGAVNVNRRREILLPANSPAPSALSQIVATGDITADGLPDMFATTGSEMWAFIGYTGASFTEARMVANSPWADRDILTVADISGDGTPDLLFRGPETERGLLLRHGKPAAGGGVDLASLTTAAGSKTGRDEVYGTTGWGTANIPKIIGTPDVNRDGIPDLWACLSDGRLYFYPGGRTSHGTRFLSSASGWLSATAIG